MAFDNLKYWFMGAGIGLIFSVFLSFFIFDVAWLEGLLLMLVIFVPLGILAGEIWGNLSKNK